MTGWRDTTGEPLPRSDSSWWEARWLVGRCPRLQGLVMRLGVWDDEEAEGGRWVDTRALQDTVRGHEEYVAAFADYSERRSAPQDDARYEAWLAAGPRTGSYGPPREETHGRDAVRELGVMSGGEQRLVRLLATVGDGRVPWGTKDLWGLDDEGWRFVRDWIALLGPR